MSFVGRICGQFQGILRSSKALSAFQSEQCLTWNQPQRFYTRKANLARKAKKAAERALKKNELKFVKTKISVRPFPVDKCAVKEPSTDDVWFKCLHPYKRLGFEEAINYHRETAHKTVFNNLDAFVNVVAVLNLKTKKEGVNLDKIRGVYIPVHTFPTGKDMQILALCKTQEDVEKAKAAGAAVAGGIELIKSIEEGNLQVEEYDTVVAHTDVLTHLTPIRGLLRTKFPKAAQGTMGRDIAAVINKVRESRTYNLLHDSENPSLGWVDSAIGRLNMSLEHLADNFHGFLSGILKQQPRNPDTGFITDLYVKSASGEVFLLDRSLVLKEEVRDTVGNKRELIQRLIVEEEEKEKEVREAAQN